MAWEDIVKNKIPKSEDTVIRLIDELEDADSWLSGEWDKIVPKKYNITKEKLINFLQELSNNGDDLQVARHEERMGY